MFFSSSVYPEPSECCIAAVGPIGFVDPPFCEAEGDAVALAQHEHSAVGHGLEKEKRIAITTLSFCLTRKIIQLQRR